MKYVITNACVGTCDTACVQVCPMDCIEGPIPLREITLVPQEQRKHRWPSLQLYINPEHCIDCGACAPECPVDAIYEDSQVPAEHFDSIEENANFFRKR